MELKYPLLLLILRTALQAIGKLRLPRDRTGWPRTMLCTATTGPVHRTLRNVEVGEDLNDDCLAKLHWKCNSPADARFASCAIQTHFHSSLSRFFLFPVNPLLYREAELRNDFSGNSIPQNGVWEDVDVPLPGMPYPLELFDAPIEPGPFDRFNQQQQQQRTYDVLQNLLSRQPSPYNPLFIGRPVSGGYPVRMHGSGGAYGTERKKRTLATRRAKSYSHQMR